MTKPQCNTEYNLIFVYGHPRASGPENSEKRIKFVEEIEKAHKTDKVNMVIGDFNLIDGLYDKPPNLKVSYNKNLDNHWQEIRNRCKLVDPFRKKFPTMRKYSFESKDKKRRSRIDKVYIDEREADKITKNIFIETPFFDHKVLEVLYEHNQKKGSGTWKLNTSLLQDPHYVERIRTVISKVLSRSNRRDDPGKKWDILLMTIKSISIDFSTKKAFQKRKVKTFLLKELAKYNEFKPEQLIEAVMKRIENLEKQLHKILMDEINGYKVRTGIPDFEKKEPRIDFYNKLEKSQGAKSSITALKNDKNETKTETKDLKEIAHKFYTKLYNEEDTSKRLQNKILAKVRKRLSRSQREKLDCQITGEEIRKAVFSQAKEKTPGIDGLPAEFYQIFWEEIKEPFTKLLDHAARYGFTDAQNTSVIKLLYKKGDNEDLANYRPIALINSDIKILTKILANRLKELLPHIIHYTQTCVKGRKIDTTIHTVRDLIQLAEQKNLNAAFIFLDQEKAFDRVNHSFLFKVMEKFNIGDNFINWVRLIYQNAKTRILINGHLTGKIDLKRGVRQGDPLSALLYVMVIEILAIQLRTNPNIIGFTIKKEKLVSFHYADDTTIAITQNKCWKEVIKELEQYEEATGAKINAKKTFGLWAGNWKDRTDKPMDIKWTNTNVKALGVYMGNNKPNELLLEEIYAKMCTSINFWKTFHFSKFAKARIIEIFISSKLWYAAKFIEIPTSFVNKFQKLLNDFIIYPHKANMIATDELYKLRTDGGIKLINIDLKAQASKIKWLTQVITDEKRKTNRDIIDELIGEQVYGYAGLNCIYLSKGIVKKMKISSPFYDQTIKKLANLEPQKKIENPDDENIMYNKLFQNESGNMVFSAYLNKANIWKYGQLKEEKKKKGEGQPHDKKAVLYLEKIEVNQYMLQDFNSIEIQTQNKTEQKDISQVTEKEIYTTLLRKTHYKLHISEVKWIDYFDDIVHFPDIWISLNNKYVNEDTRTYVWEQIHLNFFNTYWFNKISKNNSDKNTCPLCKNMPANSMHLIIECPLVRKLWKEIEPILKKYDDTPISNIEMAFGLTSDRRLQVGQQARNWITYKLRETITKQERFLHDKPELDADYHIRIALKKELVKELTYKYHIAKKENKIDEFLSFFNSACDVKLINIQNENIMISDILKSK